MGEFGYPKDRVKWWIKKSEDAYHQRAYKDISDLLGGHGTLLDLGSGTGELLWRAKRRGFERVIGIEGNTLLVNEAQRVLSQHKTEFKRVGLNKVGERGVYLVQRDYFDLVKSNLEVDYVTVLFQQAHLRYDILKDNPIVDYFSRHKKRMVGFFPQSYALTLCLTFANSNRVLPIQGRILLANYLTLPKDGDLNELKEAHNRLGSLLGFEFEDIKFFESKVYQDSIDEGNPLFRKRREDMKNEGARLGYFVIEGEKVRDVSF